MNEAEAAREGSVSVVDAGVRYREKRGFQGEGCGSAIIAWFGTHLDSAEGLDP